MRWSSLVALMLVGCGKSGSEVNAPVDTDPMGVDTSAADTGMDDSGADDSGGGDTGTSPDTDDSSDTDGLDSDSGDTDAPDTGTSDTDTSDPGDTDDTGLFGGGGLTPSDLMCFVRPVLETPVYRWLYDPSTRTDLPDVPYEYWDDREFILRDADHWRKFEAILGLDLPDPDFATEQALASLYVANSSCALTLGGAGVTQMLGGHSLLQVSWTDASLGCDTLCRGFFVGLAVVAVPRENDGHICQTINPGCEGPPIDPTY